MLPISFSFAFVIGNIRRLQLERFYTTSNVIRYKVSFSHQDLISEQKDNFTILLTIIIGLQCIWFELSTLDKVSRRQLGEIQYMHKSF